MAYKVDQKTLLENLPTNIQDTKELSIQAKKLLGALLHWILYSRASETGHILIGNNALCTIAGISTNNDRFNKALDELLRYNLIERKVGHKRAAGEKNQASEYIIHWDCLEKPLKALDYNERFSAFKKLSGYIDKYSIDKISIEKNSIDQKSEDKLSIDKISEDQKSEDKIRKDNIENIIEENINKNGQENKSLNKNEDMIFEIKNTNVEDILEYLTINKRLQEKDDWNECLQLANVIKDEVENLSISNNLKKETFNRLRIIFNAKRHKLNQAKEKPVQEKVEDNTTTESEEGFNLFMNFRPKVQWETSIEKLQQVKEEATNEASRQRIQSNDKYLIDLYKMIDERITMLQQEEDAPQEENVPQAV